MATPANLSEFKQHQGPPPEIIRATAASLQSMLGMVDKDAMPQYVTDDVNRLAASLDKWAGEVEAKGQ